jgi:hypothetical protein
MDDTHAKEDVSIAVVKRNVDDANAFVTNVDKESGKGICEKAKWMSLLLGQD